MEGDPAVAALMDAIIGPFGALVGAVAIIGYLWREWRKAEDANRALLQQAVTEANARTAVVTAERDVAITGWKEQTEANLVAARALEEDVRDRSRRHRAADRGSSG